MSTRWSLALGAALLSLLPWVVNLVALWLWLPPETFHASWWASLVPAVSTALAALSVTLLHFERASTRVYPVRRLLFWGALVVLQFVAASMQASMWYWVVSSLRAAGWLPSHAVVLQLLGSPLLTPLTSAALTVIAMRVARGQPSQSAPAEVRGTPGFALSHAMALQIGFMWVFGLLWSSVQLTGRTMAHQTLQSDAALAVLALLMGVATVAVTAQAVAIRPGALPRLTLTLPMALLTGAGSSLLAFAIVGKLVRREIDPMNAIALTIAASVVIAMSLTVRWIKWLAGVRRAAR